jgi:hypothetical protein
MRIHTFARLFFFVQLHLGAVFRLGQCIWGDAFEVELVENLHGVSERRSSADDGAHALRCMR